ncbi:MAG: phosphoglycolate phosphatase [Flavobacteriales bacterium]|nr:phosphoglycolate phosphatase [Flavobacteriales bacterium]MBK21317.1 phosphoglycolate phosphatase [Flavobacteriales bacterium]MBO72577.1 phosphoglycolate phosphatase [Flavobacteriales bacterium]|tara:strand:- start:1459 stop:2121 length:663 start_codon:yes stop_codon:yes gene_type:complete
MKNHFVLFDLDGTITDSSEGIINSILYALKKMGKEESDFSRLRSYVGPSLKTTFQNHYFPLEEDSNKAIAYYREYYAKKGIYENRLYSGIYDVLKEIKGNGGIIALATAKPTYFAKIILKHFEIMGCFDVVVGSHLRGTRTQKDEIIFEVLDQLGFPDSREVFMVGDREYDIIGGKHHRLKTIGVNYGYGTEGELFKVRPDYIVKSPFEILDCIKLFTNQ